MSTPDKSSLRQATLLAMYRSVDRMNRHVANNNASGVIAEQKLQENLRQDFVRFQED